MDPGAEPWNDPKHGRQVRWIGLFLTLYGLVLLGSGIALIA